jgi:hypothetical protein
MRQGGTWTGTHAKRREKPSASPRNLPQYRSCVPQARIPDRSRTAIATAGVGIADAPHDSACVNVAPVDQPGLLKRAMVAAAGEGGHAA